MVFSFALGILPLSSNTGDAMQITPSLVKQFEDFHNLTIEAADALWAMDKGKKPNRNPRQINQDIYNSRSLIEHNLRLMKEEAQQAAPTR